MYKSCRHGRVNITAQRVNGSGAVSATAAAIQEKQNSQYRNGHREYLNNMDVQFHRCRQVFLCFLRQTNALTVFSNISWPSCLIQKI
jgi:hypothetical protein